MYKTATWASPQPKADEVDVDQIIQALEERLDSIPVGETRQKVIEAIESLGELATNAEGHRETIDCLTEIVENSTPIDDIQFILAEGEKLVRLLIQKNAETAACEAIGGDNPSILDRARIRICLAGVEATTGAQVAVSTYRIRQAANRLSAWKDDVRLCVDHLISG